MDPVTSHTKDLMMKPNTFLTLFTIFTISSLAMVGHGLAQTETRLEPNRNSFMKLGDIKGEFMKLGDIKGEAMSAPRLGGIYMPNPKAHNAIEIAVQPCSDDHTEVLFAGFNGLLSSVIPGYGVLEGITDACYQLSLEGMSDNESESAIGIGTGPGGVIDWENF